MKFISYLEMKLIIYITVLELSYLGFHVLITQLHADDALRIKLLMVAINNAENSNIECRGDFNQAEPC